jgi:hypothetical protein
VRLVAVRLHVENVECRPRTGWVLEVAVSSWVKRRIPIRVQTGSPAASFVPLLREKGIEVIEMSLGEHAAAAGQFLDACEAGTLRHAADVKAPNGSTVLSAAVRGAELRPSGDVNVWARRSSKVNITPLVAVTLALGGVPAAVSTYEGPLVAFR